MAQFARANAGELERLPYRILKGDGSVEAAIRRIAREQIDGALASLQVTGEARATAVHDVRKRCKKLRGLLRIVRPSCAAYTDENATFREATRLLSDARDARVLRNTFDAVTADLGRVEDRPDLARMRVALTSPTLPVQSEGDLDAQFAKVREMLLAARGRAQDWTLREEGWDALEAGVGKTYARARKAMRQAARMPDAERHHEWRKHAKYHSHHARLLRCIWPEQMKHRAREARDLAELVGNHHDCHVLEEALVVDREACGPPDAVETVTALARRRRALLEEQAHRLGARLLAEKPGKLVGRWGDWWRAWRSEGDLQ